MRQKETLYMNTCVCFYAHFECDVPCIYQTEKCFELEL